MTKTRPTNNLILFRNKPVNIRKKVKKKRRKLFKVIVTEFVEGANYRTYPLLYGNFITFSAFY